MRQGFTALDPNTLRDLILALLMIGSLLVLAWMLHRKQLRDEAANGINPMALFIRMMTRLGLPVVDRVRMWHLARVLRIPHPTALLISTTLFRKACEDYCATRGWMGPRARAVAHLNAIARQLFDRPAGTGSLP